MAIVVLEVFAADRARVDVECLRGLEVLEALQLLEREGALFGGDRLDRDDLVVAEAEMVQRLEEFRAGRIEVADDEDDGPPWNALGDLVQDVRHLRLAAGTDGVDGLEDVADLRRLGLGGHEGPHRGVVGDEADGVLLSDEQVGDRGGEMTGVVKLGESVRRGLAAVGHRARDVEDDRRAQVGLVDVLLDVEALTARDQLPVEVAQVVAGHVLAVLGELDARALAGAAVLARNEAVDGAVRQELQVSDRLQRRLRQPLHVRSFSHAGP